MTTKICIALKDISLILLILTITLKETATKSIGNSPEANGLQIVLSELERISATIKNIGTMNEKLIASLRDNATRYGFKSRNSEDFALRGYTCTSGIGWHKLYLSNLTWNEARKACRKDDAQLAIINSDSEAKALKSMLLENYQFSAYIGIHNQFKEDEWVTVFGDPLAETGYNRWSVGPPKISEANCGVLFEDGKLLGIPCHAERSYFCEIPGMPTC